MANILKKLHEAMLATAIVTGATYTFLYFHIFHLSSSSSGFLDDIQASTQLIILQNTVKITKGTAWFDSNSC